MITQLVVFARCKFTVSQESQCLGMTSPKKPLTCVSKPAPGVRGKTGLAEKNGRKGWQRVGEGLAGFLGPSNFAISEVPI